MRWADLRSMNDWLVRTCILECKNLLMQGLAKFAGACTSVQLMQWLPSEGLEPQRDMMLVLIAAFACLMLAHLSAVVAGQATLKR